MSESTNETTDTAAPSFYALAQEAYGWFETRTRDDGDKFVCLKDDRPDWVYDLAYEAHGDFGPDDWRYDCIWSALGHICDTADVDADADDVDGREFADGHVDVYTGARLKWLASNVNRPAYCDEAAEEFGGDGQDIIAQIGLGQYVEALEVFSSVVRSLSDRAEMLADEAAEEAGEDD